MEVLLAHPGGPFWRSRDAGAWSIPKGGLEAGETSLQAACREFAEETGLAAPAVPYVALTPVRQKAGKVVEAFAVEADLVLGAFSPGLFPLEWPPRSGRTVMTPEVDRIAYFALEEAAAKLIEGQRALLDDAAFHTAIEGAGSK